MKNVGGNRSTLGVATGLGGNEVKMKTVTANISAGANSIVHNLGETPELWIIQDSSGRVQVLAAEPNSGAPTTTLDVTGLAALSNAEITVISFNPASGNAVMRSITQNLTTAGNPNQVVHGLGETPTMWIILNSSGQIQIVEAEPNSGNSSMILDVTVIADISNAVINVFAATS